MHVIPPELTFSQKKNSTGHYNAATVTLLVVYQKKTIFVSSVENVPFPR